MLAFSLQAKSKAALLNKVQSLVHGAARLPAYQKEQSLLYVAAQSLPYHQNGYSLRTHELALALRSAGLKVVVIKQMSYPWDSAAKKFAQEKSKHIIDDIIYYHHKNPSKWRRWFAINSYMEKCARLLEQYAVEHRVSCIHAASDHINAIPALMAARRLGLKFHYEIRGIWELSRACNNADYAKSTHYINGLKLETLVANEADAVFCISSTLADFYRQDLKVNFKELHLLPNCVNMQNVRSESIPELEQNCLVYAGSLVEYEGLDILLKAMHILCKSGVNVKLKILGDGPSRAKLEALCAELGLQNNVFFYGRVAHEVVQEQILKSAMVCIPRVDFEVCKLVPPLKLVEAMALGKAVLLPNLPVLKEESGNAPNYFYEAGCAKKLAETLQHALQRPSEIYERGQVCRDYVLKSRQWQQYLEPILRSYSI